MMTKLNKKDWELNVNDAIKKAGEESFIYQDTQMIDDKNSIIELSRMTENDGIEHLLLFVAPTTHLNVFNAIIVTQ